MSLKELGYAIGIKGFIGLWLAGLLSAIGFLGMMFEVGAGNAGAARMLGSDPMPLDPRGDGRHHW